MKLSIVVPSYEDAHELNGFLNSAVQYLSKEEAEIIIQDGAGNAAVSTLIKKYSSNLFITHTVEPDNGIYYAVLKGIDKAKSNWIMIMGSDDRILPDINTLLPNLKNPREIHYANVKLKINRQIYDGQFTAKKLYLRNICQQSVIYPKSAIKQMANYRLDSMYCDYMLHIDLWNSPHYNWIYHDLIIAEYNETGVSSSVKNDYFYKHHRSLKEPLLKKATNSSLKFGTLWIINETNMWWNRLRRIF